MSEQKDLQTQVENEEELLVTKLHSEVLLLLGIDQLALSRQNFLLHLSLLQAILVTRGIDASLLTYEQIFLLTFYHMGCQLRKQGVVREFEFERIKKEKFNELEIDYYPSGSGGEESGGDSCGSNKNFCSQLDAFLEKLKRETATPSCVGVV
ncbi:MULTISPECIES: DUF3890 domain-containing protein [Borreliella]|uniref:DUF3890 domain-containing protein n=4 Tax=Borreliella TaxID=64895 RepID=B9X9E0_9SPIR|nr:DUF3890 domain-containing protein [Borreliella spielmanii]ACJ73266.1 conserved hypothetical protein [Borreliella afzelii ACA-1]APJ09379.1 hypothetical protein BLA32_05815 [Borreliella afzelii]EEF84005.1 conserved hypothetical protein [Borreliella spielmanii A14S]